MSGFIFASGGVGIIHTAKQLKDKVKNLSEENK